MRALRVGAIGLCVLLVASACVAQTTLPTNVQAVDDPDDPQGVQMILTWEPPEQPLDLLGLQPVAQRVLHREVGGEWQRGPVAPLDATTTPVGDMKPWPWPQW
ncbi:MAG: hypothetical protein ACOCX2_09605, partial [Armatimonadota bacterium]